MATEVGDALEALTAWAVAEGATLPLVAARATGPGRVCVIVLTDPAKGPPPSRFAVDLARDSLAPEAEARRLAVAVRRFLGGLAGADEFAGQLKRILSGSHALALYELARDVANGGGPRSAARGAA